MIFSISELPPPAYLYQVASHCHKAVKTYIDLWRNRNTENIIRIYQDDIRKQYLVSTAKFRHDLFLLANEGLLNFDEFGKDTKDMFLKIELVDWNVEAV